MLLKKQTIWLLTMLSLVVVLSVYYIMSPETTGNQVALTNEEEKEETTEENGKSSDVKEEGEETVISSIASEEAFEALRLKLDEERSKKKETYQQKLAETDLSSEERSEAYDEIEKLEEAAKKEAVLESLIISMGYEDALVRADGEKVRITVKSNEPSAEKANEIIRLVKNEIGDMQAVAVTFQPGK